MALQEGRKSWLPCLAPPAPAAPLAWSSPGGPPGCRPEQAGTLPWSPGLPGAFIQEGPDQDLAWQLLKGGPVCGAHTSIITLPQPRWLQMRKLRLQGRKGLSLVTPQEQSEQIQTQIWMTRTFSTFGYPLLVIINKKYPCWMFTFIDIISPKFLQ